MAEIEAGEARGDAIIDEMLLDALPKYSPAEIAYGDFGAAHQKAEQNQQ
jgi:hypothetical protein